MKILYVLNHFFPDQIAGTEVYVKTLASLFIQKGLSITVLIPNYGETENVEYIIENIKVIKYAEPSIVDRALIMGKRKPDGLPFFLDIVKNEIPDIVHFHELAGSNGITLSHVLALKKLNLKVVFTAHLAGYSCKTGNLFYENKILCNGQIDYNKCTRCVLSIKNTKRWKAKFIYGISKLNYRLGLNTTHLNSSIGTALGYHFVIKKLEADLIKLVAACDKFIVLTDWYKRVLSLNNIDKSKFALIKQGLPNGKFALKNTLGTFLPLKVIFIGRISHFKGLHILLEAFKSLPSDKILLNIYGKDNDDEYAQVNKLVASRLSNVYWHGVLEPSLVLQKMQQNHLLCLPSTFSEMSPLVIQEAFAAGLPVLASNVYGNADQITDGKNGWLFKFNDSNDLKNKLQQLINDPSLIEKAKQHIVPVKSFEKVAEEHEKLYKGILAVV